MPVLIMVLLIIFLPIAVGFVVTGSLGFIALIADSFTPGTWGVLGAGLLGLLVVGFMSLMMEASKDAARREREARERRGSGWLP